MAESNILRMAITGDGPVLGPAQGVVPSSVIFQLLGLVESSSALIAAYDPDDRLRFANAAFRAAYFVGPDETPTWEEIMRRNHAAGRGAVLTATDLDAWFTSVLSRRGKVPQRRFETDLLDGRWLNIEETVLPDGWSIFVASDVTTLRASERSLRQARDQALISSHTDELTGVSNRRMILAQLQDTIALAQSRNAVSCACLLDIDHFKAVNDQMGHLVGDTVLTAFARAVQRNTRTRDCFGRVGGEEFMLVLTDMTIQDAMPRVADILNRVRALRIPGTPPDFTTTCSGGLTDIRPSDTTMSVFSRCDTALYAAKNAGRDQVRTFES